MSLDSPSILIGTLYSGENEFKECKRSVAEQDYPSYKHFVIENLPNREAHNKLYDTFMSKSEEYDLFIKLDADMVFKDTDVLAKVADIFKSNEDLDHLILPVHDWYTDWNIKGMHVFSNRAKWKANKSENRFVDIPPQVLGKRKEANSNFFVFVDHSPNPSLSQAFRFGIHRALKIKQADRTMLNVNQIKYQWKVLNKCWKNFKATNEKKRGLILIGASLVLKGKIGSESYDKNRVFETDELKDYMDMPAEEVYETLKINWENKISRFFMLIDCLGLSRIIKTIPIYMLVSGKKKIFPIKKDVTSNFIYHN